MTIEKSYIDMLKERDAIIVTLKELLKLAHEKLGSQPDMIAELEKELDDLSSGTDDLYNMVFEHVELKLEFPDEVDHTDIKQLLEGHNLKQHDKGVDSAIAELIICYRVALDEHKDIEDAEVLEGLIDRLQALKEQE
tara:strand:- start:34 stop:444 length:411 start_codon:yes stop_codon:yes gene_type:complete